MVESSAHRRGCACRPGRGGRGGRTLGPPAPSHSSLSRFTGRLLRVAGPTGRIPLRFTGDRIDRRLPYRGDLNRRGLGPYRRRWRRRGRTHPQGNRVLRWIDRRWCRWCRWCRWSPCARWSRGGRRSRWSRCGRRCRRCRRRGTGSEEGVVLGRAPPTPRPAALGRSFDGGALQLTRRPAGPCRPSGRRFGFLPGGSPRRRYPWGGGRRCVGWRGCEPHRPERGRGRRRCRRCGSLE
jgi:hypothetical protein